jgi:hypothetical protein
MLKSFAVAAAVVSAFAAPAFAECVKGEVLRTNTQGKPQCVDGIRTFDHCVRGGMQLGYPKEGATRYCEQRGLRGPR